MKRDWDLVRQVLLEVEALQAGKAKYKTYTLKGEGDDELAAHAVLLWKSGFIEGTHASGMSIEGVMAQDLTWNGHELLNTMKTDKVWLKVKDMASEKGLELTLDSVKSLGKMAWDSIFSGMS